MPQVINTNIASLNAQRNLNASQGEANTALERLSSGLRINSAKDDAAGLAISERFQSQISGLNQAQRNANDGISLAQTAEGAMDEITSNLQRIRELAVQSANATNSISDRQALNQEVQQRVEEINRVAAQTSFNGLKVLDGTFGTQTFQVGANSGETIGISGLDSRGSQLGTVLQKTSGLLEDDVPVDSRTGPISLDTSTNLGGSVTINGVALDLSGESASDVASLGSTLDGLVSGSSNPALAGITISGDNTTGRLTVTNDSGEDVPVSFNVTDDSGDEILTENIEALGGGIDAFFDAGNSGSFDFEINGVSFTADNVGSLSDIVGQVNARSNETGVKANLDRTNSEIIFSSQQGEDFDVAIETDITGDGTPDWQLSESATAAANTFSLNDTDISTPDGADQAMITIDYAIDKINGFRAELGAVQNRFESTIANLATTSENLSASNSRIRDADFAAESAELARTQVLQQAGLSVLSQANARPQQVLQLLQG
ncbi:MAG: flagellin [Pseudomonadota bacterium]